MKKIISPHINANGMKVQNGEAPNSRKMVTASGHIDPGQAAMKFNAANDK